MFTLKETLESLNQSGRQEHRRVLEKKKVQTKPSAARLRVVGQQKASIKGLGNKAKGMKWTTGWSRSAPIRLSLHLNYYCRAELSGDFDSVK